jgi:hypothetical protein
MRHDAIFSLGGGRDKKQSTVDNPMDSVSVKIRRLDKAADRTGFRDLRDIGEGPGGRRFPARLSSLLFFFFFSSCRVTNYKLWITSCLLFVGQSSSAPMEIPAFYASRVKRGCGVSGLESRDPEPETQRKCRVENGGNGVGPYGAEGRG